MHKHHGHYLVFCKLAAEKRCYPETRLLKYS